MVNFRMLAGLPAALGSVEQLLADNGYFSAANVERCVEAKIEPLLGPRGAMHTTRTGRTDSPSRLRGPSLPALWRA